MKTLLEFYQSSIGKKILAGLTGLFLCAYLLVHVGGNLLLFKADGGAAFDAYAETLPNFLIIRVIEIGLFAAFAVHIATGTYLWVINRRARPRGYLVNKPEENSSFASRTMFLTGSIVFVFLVVHMKSFWYPSRFSAEQRVSMYSLVTGAFADPLYSSFYIAAMALLAIHLRHGFQSAFQTFGLRNRKYAPLIESVGVIFWLLIPAAFAAMPAYCFYRSCQWLH
ncbi:MAG TPA: succinate dehydrogenase cytochrome b subunit [Bacteroidota bacterium]|nr:succinate dehydrogenase cytochrome b subunit [Bacteroidota bacterium]